MHKRDIQFRMSLLLFLSVFAIFDATKYQFGNRLEVMCTIYIHMN